MENNIQLSFDTVTESLEWLKSQGYTHDFNVEHECLETCEIERSFSPDDFFIDYIFRFEADTDPSEEDIVYGISSDKNNVKGIMTSAYGAYADSVSNQLIARLVVRQNLKT